MEEVEVVERSEAADREIIEHPFRSFLHFGLDLRENITATGNQAVSAVKRFGMGLLGLAWYALNFWRLPKEDGANSLKCLGAGLLNFIICLFCTVKHLILLVLSPILNIFVFIHFRNWIIKQHPEYRKTKTFSFLKEEHEQV